MLGLFIWVLCFFYSIFFLGALPLPPVPGRPFAEENLGISRFPFLNETSKLVSAAGRDAPGVVAFAVFFIIFAIFMFSQSQRFVRQRNTGGFPVFRFLIVLATSFVAADFSREFAVPSFPAYVDARIKWLTNGGKLGYPKWPTVQLKNAIRSGIPSEIDGAIDAVVAPEFAKLPAYPGTSETCKAIYRDLIQRSAPPSFDERTAANYEFACHLLREVVARLGKADPAAPGECYYGPAVKVLHALERQRMTCSLNTLSGENRAAEICPKFYDLFGTRNFSFCYR